MTNNISDLIKGKRILAVDYGLKRIGTAITDEFHVTISPKELFINDDNFFDKFVKYINNENIGIIVIGIPMRNDNTETEIIREIKKFSDKINETTKKDVFLYDESFSSKEAVNVMVNIGKKKKKRSKKGEKDLIAAAVILKNFLIEYDNYPRGF